ncbi:UbiA family prenyltransferase [candidate division KSB1 bacterium]|nr:UbiA family prenyltransferase [candidate division KSB1 bacterium]
MSKFITFKQKVRWQGWSHGKIPLLCAIIFYLVLYQQRFQAQAIFDFIAFLSFSILSGIYGYLLNDLCDRNQDLKNQKKNVFQSIGATTAGWIVATVVGLSFIPGLHFIARPYFAVIWLLWFASATLYSAPPWRGKSQGLAGLMLNVSAQYTLPIALCFAAFNGFGQLDFWGILSLATISGFTQEIGHQRADLTNDLMTGTRTFAVRLGKPRIDRYYRLLLLGDLATGFGILAMMTYMTPHIYLFHPALKAFGLPLGLYVILAVLCLIQMWRHGDQILDPYYQIGRQDVLNLTFTLFPNFFLPFYLSWVLFIMHHTFLWLTLIFLGLTLLSFPGAIFLRPLQVMVRQAKNLWFHETPN